MSRGYQRADALERLLLDRAKKQRKTPVDRLQEIIINSHQPEADLRKQIPGQLEIGDKDGK